MQTQTHQSTSIRFPMPVEHQPERQSRIFVGPFGSRVEVTRELSSDEKWILEYAVTSFGFVVKTREIYNECGCFMTRGVPVHIWAREIRRVYSDEDARISIILDLLDSL